MAKKTTSLLTAFNRHPVVGTVGAVGAVVATSDALFGQGSIPRALGSAWGFTRDLFSPSAPAQQTQTSGAPTRAAPAAPALNVGHAHGACGCAAKKNDPTHKPCAACAAKTPVGDVEETGDAEKVDTGDIVETGKVDFDDNLKDPKGNHIWQAGDGGWWTEVPWPGGQDVSTLAPFDGSSIEGFDVFLDAHKRRVWFDESFGENGWRMAKKYAFGGGPVWGKGGKKPTEHRETKPHKVTPGREQARVTPGREQARVPSAQRSPADAARGRPSPRAAATNVVIDRVRSSYRGRIARLQHELAQTKSQAQIDKLQAQIDMLNANDKAAEQVQSVLQTPTPDAAKLQAQILLLAQTEPQNLSSVFQQIAPQPVAVTPAQVVVIPPQQAPMQAPWGTSPVAPGIRVVRVPSAPASPGLSLYMDRWGAQEQPQPDWEQGYPYDAAFDGEGGFSGGDTDWNQLVSMSLPGISGVDGYEEFTPLPLDDMDQMIAATGAADDYAIISQAEDEDCGCTT